MPDKSVSRTAGRRRFCLRWAGAGLFVIGSSACAHGIEPLGAGIENDAGGVAGNAGSGQSHGSAGGGSSVMSGSGGSGGSGGDSIVDMTGGSAGTADNDASTGSMSDAAVDDATETGGAVVEVGPPCPSGGKAVSFDGASRVDIPGTSLPIANSPRTIEMWVSPATATAPAWSPNHTVFEHGSGDLKTFALDMDAAPMMELYTNPAANSFFFNTGISQATWFHVATTYDGATTTHAYVNGADKGTKTLSGPLATALSTLSVGGTLASRYFIGSIDEVRVWNVARTATQIQQTMSVRLSGNEAGLVGYWQFDEGSGTTARDSSTKGIAGTLVGAVGWVGSGVTLTCK